MPKHLDATGLVSLGLSKGDPQWASAHGMEKTLRTGRRHRLTATDLPLVMVHLQIMFHPEQ